MYYLFSLKFLIYIMNCRQKLYLHRTVGRYFNKDLKQHRWHKYNLNIDVRCITLYMAFTQLKCPLDDFKLS